MTFFLKYFFYSKFFLISLLQLFFIKCSNNFFTIKIINNICPWNCIFNFTNNKNFFRPIWHVSFSKNIFIFRNSYVIINFKFWIFIVNFFFEINLCTIFNIIRFHLNYFMICIIIFIYYIIQFLDIHIFRYRSHVFIYFTF